MEVLIKSLQLTHIIAGSISLILFWIPAFTRKGGINHRKVGKWYVRFMWIVVISAAILSVKNALLGHYIMALFLGFLSLITANPLWYSISVLKLKEGLNKRYLKLHLLLHILIVAYGAFLFVLGAFFISGGVRFLMMFFGLLGLLDISELLRHKKMISSKPNWLKLHYSGMIVSGIAAYTAFLSFGGRTLFGGIMSNEWQFIPWIAPTVIGVVAIRILDRKYSKKEEDPTEYFVKQVKATT